MKNKKSAKESSVTEALLKCLLDTQKTAAEKAIQPPSIGSTPLKPSDQSHDAGGGYNPDWTAPQE